MLALVIIDVASPSLVKGSIIFKPQIFSVDSFLVLRFGCFVKLQRKPDF